MKCFVPITVTMHFIRNFFPSIFFQYQILLTTLSFKFPFLQILLYNICNEFWKIKEKGEVQIGYREDGNKIDYFNRGRITENIGGKPSERALKKFISSLDHHCIDFLSKSPFLVLSTANKLGECDASPRGCTWICLRIKS